MSAPAADGGLGGGCARKIGEAELQGMLAAVEKPLLRTPGVQVLGRTELLDVCEIELRSSVSTLVSSADLLYAVSDDRYTCGYVAAVHALSDIFAALAVPLWATVTIAVPSQDVSNRSGERLLLGISDALNDNGATYAGGHSVYASDLFVNAAVVGVASGFRRSATVPGDLVVLSKPIGSGIALAGLKLGLCSEVDLDAVYAAMRMSNRQLAAALTRVDQERAGAVRAVTDVSGFGLISAIRFLAQGAPVAVNAGAVPSFDVSLPLLGAGAVSPLADKNMLAAESCSAYAGHLPSDEAIFRILLNDPQTSGGLVSIVHPDVVDSLPGRETDGGGVAVIGMVIEGESDPGRQILVRPES